MSAFRDMVRTDRDFVFLNLDEFGEIHMIEGCPAKAVIDDPILGKSAMDAIGLAECDIIVFAKVEELPCVRTEGESLNVDGREFTVQSWREDFGIAEIKLAQQISR